MDVHLRDPRLLKSAPAKVTRKGDKYSVMGAAWGAPIAKVQVRVDGGPWQTTSCTASSRGTGAGHRTVRVGFWTFDWGTPAPGEHAITFAGVRRGRKHAAHAGRPALASRSTFWESNGQITRRALIPYTRSAAWKGTRVVS